MIAIAEPVSRYTIAMLRSWASIWLHHVHIDSSCVGINFYFRHHAESESGSTCRCEYINEYEMTRHSLHAAVSIGLDSGKHSLISAQLSRSACRLRS